MTPTEYTYNARSRDRRKLHELKARSGIKGLIGDGLGSVRALKLTITARLAAHQAWLEIQEAEKPDVATYQYDPDQEEPDGEGA